MSEGFARFESPAIVQFFGYALGSLGEVEDYLRECVTRGFIDQERFANGPWSSPNTPARRR